jgi:hypothetical protein
MSTAGRSSNIQIMYPPSLPEHISIVTLSQHDAWNKEITHPVGKLSCQVFDLVLWFFSCKHFALVKL